MNYKFGKRSSNKKISKVKTIQIIGGIIIILFSLFISFGIILSSLKEKDDSIFNYLILPGFLLALGIYLIFKSKIYHS